MFICLKEGRYQYISVVVVISYASDVILHGRRTSEQSDAPIHIKQDTTSIECKTLEHQS